MRRRREPPRTTQRPPRSEAAGSAAPSLRPAGPTAPSGVTLPDPFTATRVALPRCAVEAEIRAASPAEILARVELAHTLPGTELERAETLRHPGDAERFLAGRVLLRHALTAKVEGRVPPRAWRFRESPQGKPMMESGLPALEFNIAHAGAAVAVAVGTRPVGVDVESLAPQDRGPVIPDVLTPQELARLNQLEEERRAAAFVHLWTVKEAVAKALGLGVSLDFRTLDVTLEPLAVRLAAGALPAGSALRIDATTARCGGGLYALAVAEIAAG